MFLDRVLAWDREDILELANRLYDLDHCISYDWDGGMDCWRRTGQVLRTYLDLGDLPGQLPADISPSQRVWAMDKKGNCLICLDFESTDHGHVFDHMIRSIDSLSSE